MDPASSLSEQGFTCHEKRILLQEAAGRCGDKTEAATPFPGDRFEAPFALIVSGC